MSVFFLSFVCFGRLNGENVHGMMMKVVDEHKNDKSAVFFSFILFLSFSATLLTVIYVNAAG